MRQSFDFLEIDRYIAEMYAGKRVSVEQYAYVFDFGSSEIGATVVTSTIKTNSNVDFLWISSATPAGNGSSAGNLLVQIQDQGSGQYFFADYTPASDFASEQNTAFTDNGNAVPRKIGGASTLTASAYDPSGIAGVANVQLILFGVHVYVYD